MLPRRTGAGRRSRPFDPAVCRHTGALRTWKGGPVKLWCPAASVRGLPREVRTERATEEPSTCSTPRDQADSRPSRRSLASPGAPGTRRTALRPDSCRTRKVRRTSPATPAVRRTTWSPSRTGHDTSPRAAPGRTVEQGAVRRVGVLLVRQESAARLRGGVRGDRTRQLRGARPRRRSVRLRGCLPARAA